MQGDRRDTVAVTGRLRGSVAQSGRRTVRCVVVIPAGPQDDVADTVASVRHHVGASRAVVVLDDRGGGPPLPPGDDLHVLEMKGRSGKWGGLFANVARAYQYALEHFDFEMILRLDADALVIGHGPELDAARSFAAHPRAGLLGSYRIGPTGNPRDFSVVTRIVCRDLAQAAASDWARFRHIFRLALATRRRLGHTGAHVLGAACFHRYECVKAIADRGWLKPELTAGSRLGDDHLLSMLTAASGWDIEDFGRPEDPIAVSWRGLPMAPADLLSRGKKLTHSVRYWGEMGEEEIRNFFASVRQGGAVHRRPASEGTEA